MHEVKIDRKKLLEKIKINRKNHATEYEAASKGYRLTVIEELEKMLQEAKDGQKIRKSVTLPEPQNYTSQYDKVIAMLEMSVDKEITLDSTSFDHYVLDNWAWKESAAITNSFYLSKK